MGDSSRGKLKGRLSSLAISLALSNPTGMLDGHVSGYCVLQAVASRTSIRGTIQERGLDMSFSICWIRFCYPWTFAVVAYPSSIICILGQNASCYREVVHTPTIKKAP